jgi:hypothetical protein
MASRSPRRVTSNLRDGWRRNQRWMRRLSSTRANRSGSAACSRSLTVTAAFWPETACRALYFGTQGVRRLLPDAILRDGDHELALGRLDHSDQREHAHLGKHGQDPHDGNEADEARHGRNRDSSKGGAGGALRKPYPPPDSSVRAGPERVPKNRQN